MQTCWTTSEDEDIHIIRSEPNSRQSRIKINETLFTSTNLDSVVCLFRIYIFLFFKYELDKQEMWKKKQCSNSSQTITNELEHSNQWQIKFWGNAERFEKNTPQSEWQTLSKSEQTYFASLVHYHKLCCKSLILATENNIYSIVVNLTPMTHILRIPVANSNLHFNRKCSVSFF